jgi:hypothetical protein
MFRIGQKVVCVDDGPIDERYIGFKMEIARGEIYTVRWVGPSPHPDYLGVPAVRLVGINRGFDHNTPCNDMPFSAHRFRPIVERKTDISIFTRLLVPGSKIRETA